MLAGTLCVAEQAEAKIHTAKQLNLAVITTFCKTMQKLQSSNSNVQFFILKAQRKCFSKQQNITTKILVQHSANLGLFQVKV